MDGFPRKRCRVDTKSHADTLQPSTRQSFLLLTLGRYKNNYRQLYFSIQNLSGLPNFLARNYSEIKEGLWGYRVGHHIIFFKKHDDGSVWVDRVLHEKMDYQRHL
ncbi:MAG: type II toxin-antitoxin system RelE/ParE family toxin [Bacteroidales bacterium]|nr:type II toxin-antitoxin system RelE/ParE family toxin [Bacteroidales bacterium]